MDGLPTRTELNNGVLSSTNAMPLKNLTSDNTQSFSNNRQLFQNAYQPPVNYSLRQTTRSFFQRSTGALPHGYVVDGPKSAFQKKWIGGNRDASQTAMRRRMNSTGASMTATGPQSFKNPNDNNPRIEALARVRGGGACVPPKVTGKKYNFYSALSPSLLSLLSAPSQSSQSSQSSSATYYRIVSAGGNAYSNSLSYSGVSSGFYTYTPQNLAGTPIQNVESGGFKRSYNIMTINRTTGVTDTRTFDIFNSINETMPLDTYIQSLTSNFIVVVATYDEPQTRSNLFQVYNRIKSLGANASFGTLSYIPFKSAYILIGIPGITPVDAIERKAGTSGDSSNAFLDVRFSVLNGEYTLISG